MKHLQGSDDAMLKNLADSRVEEELEESQAAPRPKGNAPRMATITIKVVPHASRDQICGFLDKALKIQVMHDSVPGAETPKEARDYYAKEFADYRRKKPTPYMSGLRFKPPRDAARRSRGHESACAPRHFGPIADMPPAAPRMSEGAHGG